MTKTTMNKIEITRGEGPLEATPYPVGKTFTVTSWAEANGILSGIASCKRYDPHNGGGYDKTDFKVMFEDGETYEGRADVKADGDDTDLPRHIREFMGYLAGQWKPSHVTDADWQRICQGYERDGTAAGAREFLDTYEIPA